MGDAAALRRRQQFLHGFRRKVRGECLEQAHARPGAGKMIEAVETLPVHGVAAVQRRRKKGIAVRDLRPLRQPVEQCQPPVVTLQHPPSETQKGVMHIMRRHSRGDAVDVSLGHVGFLSGWKASVTPASPIGLSTMFTACSKA